MMLNPVQSNINDHCPPPLQPSITNKTTNSPFQYMHTFRYSFDKDNSLFDNKDLIANKYESIMGITPLNLISKTIIIPAW